MAKKQGKSYTPNDHRSITLNPNNPAYHAAQANRLAQIRRNAETNGNKMK